MEPLNGARELRAPVTRPKASAAADAADPSDPAAAAADAGAQHALAVQKQTFDFDTEESAELEREREALQALLLAFLKNEDEVTKKYIEMISSS